MELSIKISLSQEDYDRMLAAFKRRFGNAELTQEQMLQGLKMSAIQQINSVVVGEEQAVLDELKRGVTPLELS